MSFLPLRTARALGLVLLPLSLALPGCIGPPVGIVPNEHSQRVMAEEIAADLTHCEEIATEVLHEYGPFPPFSDNPFADAATLRGHRTKYEAACMRAKGYAVESSIGTNIERVELPPSAIEKARAPRTATSDSGGAE